jgi:integrase
VASVFKRARDKVRKGSSWYINYTDQSGIRRMVKGCPDKVASEGMARKLESEAELRRRGVIDPKEDGYARQEAKALTAHLADFKAELSARGDGANHARDTVSKATRVIVLAKFKKLSDLSQFKTMEALATLRGEGLSVETINHHIRAVKAFSRWLWRDGRARDHVLAHISTTNADADRRRVRRALTTDESIRLIEVTAQSQTVIGVDGPTRARLYAIALGTGLRSNELRTLTARRFDLDANPPTVNVLACFAKKRREATQPLPDALAEALRPWLATMDPDQIVFPISDRTAEMLRDDLIAADIAPETATGVIDFHALRGSYVSHLVSSGASVKVCQVLARHSTPTLTIGLYAKASLHDLQGAVDSLPDLSGDRPKSESMKATGTYGSKVASLCHRAGDGTGRGQSASDGTADVIALELTPETPRPNPLSNVPLDGGCREEAGSDIITGGGTRTHTGVTPQRILSPLFDRQKAINSKPLRIVPYPLSALCHRGQKTDTDLAILIERWISIPETVRAGIMAMVQAMTFQGKKKSVEKPKG